MNKRRCIAKRFSALFFTSSRAGYGYLSCMLFTTQQKLQFRPVLPLAYQRPIRFKIPAIHPDAHAGYSSSPAPPSRARAHVVAVASRMCHVASRVSCQLTNRVTTRAYAHTIAQKRNTGQCIIRQSLVELQRFAQNKTTNRLRAHILIVRYTYIGSITNVLG